MKNKASSSTETVSTSHNTEAQINANLVNNSFSGSEKEIKRQLYELEIQLKNLESTNKELQKSEARYKTMLAALGDVICIVGTDTLINYISPNVEKFGWHPEELVGIVDIWKLVHPDELEELQNVFNTLLLKDSESLILEARIKCKSGSYKWVQLTVVNRVNDANIAGILVNYHDISERRKAEEEVREQKHFFEQIFSQSSLSTQILDKEGWCERINPKMSEIFGVKPVDIQGKFYNVFRDESILQGGIMVHLEKVFNEGKTVEWENHYDIGLSSESQNIKVNDKKKAWFHNWAYPIFDDKGSINHVIIQHIDITERKKAEEAIQQVNNELKNLHDNLDEAIFSFDFVHKKLLRVSAAHQSIFGFPPSEFFKKPLLWYELTIPEDKPIVDVGFHNLHLGKDHQHQVRILRSDGQQRWIEARMRPTLDINGNLLQIDGITTDITARKEAENALRNSELRLRTLVQTIPDLIWLKDLDGVYLFCNTMFERFFGASEAEIVGKTDYDYVSRELADFFRKNDCEAMVLGKSTSNEEWITFADDGHQALLDTRKTPMVDAAGKIIGILGIGHDITMRYEDEKALKKSEIRFRSYFELPIAGIAITGVSTAWIEVNDHLCQMLGYSRAELVRKTWTELTHPDDLQNDRNHYSQVLKGEIDGYSIDKRFICKNGEILWTSISVRCVRKENAEIDYFIALLLDISQRKQSEAALKESEERYRSIFDNATIGIYRTLPDGRFLLANRALVQMLGYENFEDMVEVNLEIDGFNPDYQRSEFRQRIEREGNITDMEFAWKRKDQSTIFVRESAKVYRNYKGQVLYYEGIIEDITKRKQDEREIKLLAHSLESINECVSITDKNDMIVYTNESLLQTYGYTQDELIGKHIGILRPTELAHLQLKDILLSMGDGGWRGEIMNKKKDGTVFPILLSTSVIRDDNENAIALIGVARDITELKRNREELIAAKDKAEENDQLKSAFLNNMSHEIRTPMNAIIGFSDLMLDAGEDERILYSGIVQKSSKQLLMLIDDVIHLSRLQSERLPLNIVEFKPSDIVTDIYQMFNLPDFRKGLDLLINIPQRYKDLTICSDADKIRQILTNLTSNALRYTLKGSVELGFELNNGNAEFYVKDTGIGIPDNEVQQIFESFYRGKEAVSFAIGGTGLGLNIAKMLVELLGGIIGVDSEYEIGSRFYFNVPSFK